MSFIIHPINALTDNYIWLIETPSQAWVVDPGEALPVFNKLSELNLNLAGILLTHHHHDHTDGVTSLLAQFPNARVFAGHQMQKPYITDFVQEGDQVDVDGIPLEVLETPGHTLDHIAFYNDQVLFSGDTLFTGGCGRVFEGTYEQMAQSLLKLRGLSDTLAVYCGHEYTLANMNFARIAEPMNPAVIERRNEVRNKRLNKQACVPSTLGLEKQTNPFLRFDLEPLANLLNSKTAADNPMTTDLFTACRGWKDQLDKTDLLNDIS